MKRIYRFKLNTIQQIQNSHKLCKFYSFEMKSLRIQTGDITLNTIA